MENVHAEFPQTPALTALRRFRHTVLVKTEQLLQAASPPAALASVEPVEYGQYVDGVDHSEHAELGETRAPALALLAASLEELKVAEEELRESNVQLEKRRLEGDTQATYYRALFLNAPFPALITDSRATILEINERAAELFRREAHLLVQKPLPALLELTCRSAFRQQFARLSPDRNVADWDLTFRRTGDVPIRTSASVAQIYDPMCGHPTVLYWALRVVSVEN
jgi:PAS domain-containing protein